jgi:CRISPR/Cas system CSM-associated protein Csm2 small subunit
VHMQFKNNVNGGKFHETLSSIFGFSNNNQRIKRHRALQEKIIDEVTNNDNILKLINQKSIWIRYLYELT